LKDDVSFMTQHVSYLQAAGGSGHYSWTSDVTSIASVNTRGLLTTSTETGMTEVKAHDLSNSMHFGVAQVLVLTVVLEILVIV